MALWLQETLKDTCPGIGQRVLTPRSRSARVQRHGAGHSTESQGGLLGQLGPSHGSPVGNRFKTESLGVAARGRAVK